MRMRLMQGNKIQTGGEMDKRMTKTCVITEMGVDQDKEEKQFVPSDRTVTRSETFTGFMA